MYAQPINASTLTFAEGLPSNDIQDLLQSPDGRIWIASRSGISSYNGIRFTNYTIKDGLIHPKHSYLCIDNNNSIYSLPDYKTLIITKFENNTWHTLPALNDSLLHVYATGLETVEWENNTIVGFSTANNGFFYLSEKEWTHLTPEMLGCTNIHTLIQYSNSFLLGTDKGLISITSHGIDKSLSKLLPKPESAIYALSRNKDQSILIVDETTIAEIVNNEYSKLLDVPKTIKWNYQSTRLRCLKDRFNRIYVGEETQLYYINNNETIFHDIDINRGLTAEGVTSLLEDSENNVWIGSSRGISIISASLFLNSDKKDGFLENEITSIIEPIPGKIILGHNMGFTILKDLKVDKIIRIYEKTNYSIDFRIQDMTTDEKGNTYFASGRRGFGKISVDNTLTWIDDPAFANNDYFTSVYYDLSTDRLWCSTVGIIGYLEKGKPFTIIETKIPNIAIRKIFKLRDGNIYLALNKDGIIKIEPNGEIQHIYDKNGTDYDNNVYSLFLDSLNTLWIGTNQSLHYYQNNKFFKSLENHPTFVGPAYQINEDSSNNVWIGGENNVMRWNGKLLIEYSPNEGYGSQETNRDAFLVTSTNKVLIGGSAGLSIYNPKYDFDPIKQQLPNCEITGIQVGDSIFNPYSALKLSFSQNSILISFTPITHIGKNKIIQQIKLVGLDTEWRTLEDKFVHSAFYSNLVPGSYNFLYRVSNNQGVTWCRAEVSSVITIQNPFWRTWWFIGAIFLLVAGISILIFYLITKQQYANELEEKVKIRTKELQKSNNEKDTFFSIIAHDLKSPFNAIIGFSDILKNDFDSFTEDEKKLFIANIHEASENTYKLIEKLLHWSRAKTGRLNYQPIAIDLSVLGSAMITTYRNAGAKKNIVIKSHIGYHSKVYADQGLLETVFRNLISNAIKYSNPGGEIILSAEKADDMTIIHITDNGIGMKKEEIDKLFSIDKKTSTPGTQEETGTGLGLIVCKEFCEVNKGNIWVDSQLGKGSVFSFSVPSKKPE